MIGENLGLALVRLGIAQPKQIVLLNDTVATLLAGRAEASGRRFDSYIGFILGTGTNTAYVEQNNNINKAKDLDADKSQIINVESGGFGKAPRGKIDKAFDAASVSPGVNIFEKMISGAYIGPAVPGDDPRRRQGRAVLRPAAAELAQISTATTKDIDNFLTHPERDDNPLSRASGECRRKTSWPSTTWWTH